VAVRRAEFNCEACRARGSDYCGTDRGQGPAPFPRWTALPPEILDGLDAPTGLCVCPLGLVPDWWPGLRGLFESWERGIPATAGGHYQQPATWGQAMLTLKAAIDEYSRQYLAEKESRK
jgi:hypothetical protein